MQLRISYATGAGRLVDARQFVEEVAAQTRAPEEASLGGPVIVAALDALGQTRWEAYCSTRKALAALASQLDAELDAQRRTDDGRG